MIVTAQVSQARRSEAALQGGWNAQVEGRTWAPRDLALLSFVSQVAVFIDGPSFSNLALCLWCGSWEYRALLNCTELPVSCRPHSKLQGLYLA